ncbi:neprilysin-4-like [Dendronephthya gigantea]|uniref:neprilysin-4-like n=1 Tax=Dendronephthya gigantea TaxID=151771 RepID=UPI00106A8643|nr:neprilysin-4-like [Dendronephthya gigantea]
MFVINMKPKSEKCVIFYLLLFLPSYLSLNQRPNSIIRDKNAKVCTHEHCRRVSDEILRSINVSVNPCDNFFQYSCGSWIKNHTIPKGRTQFSAITQLSLNNEKILMDALEKDEPTDSPTIKKVKNFYRSCLDTKTIDQRGVQPALNFINEMHSWELASDGSWDQRKWDFYDTLRLLHKTSPAEIFFVVDVIPNPVKRDKSKKDVILIDQASLDLPQIIYFTSATDIRLLWRYMTEVGQLVGAETNKSAETMKEVIKFEAELAKILVPKSAKRYVKVPLHKLEKAVPGLDWHTHLKSLFEHRTINKSEPVVILANSYIPKMVDLVKKTKKSTLSNYMVWRTLKEVVPLLDERFRKTYYKFKEKIQGPTAEKPRRKICFSYTDNILGPLLGSLFVRKAFSPESKAKVEEMMSKIIQAFKENAKEEHWLSLKSQKAVREKVDAATIKVGYPHYLWNEMEFADRYHKLEITDSRWFENIVNTDRFSLMQTFAKLGQKRDRRHWITVPHLVNAFYVITKNEVVIPAGILQPPFFYSDVIPRSISYGAIGHVLGHELTHGFDDTGRKFNNAGELIGNGTGWSKVSIKRFEEKAKCLVKQFGKYKVLNKFHVDGKETLGENMADGGGIKMAYRAYLDWIKEHGEEEVLPELDKTSQQLFFIGYAQKECTKTTSTSEFISVTEDVHAPTKFRVLGTLANMKEFSEAFNCPLGSTMNPTDKCDVW